MLAAEALEAALGLFWAGLASDESESESEEEDSTFFLDFLTSLTGAAFSTSFLDFFLSTLTFLGGASDEELSESELLDETTGFFVFYIS